jgi:ankyrin repeat protein
MFHYFAKNGLFDCINYFSKKVNLEIRNKEGNTPLHIAILNQKLDVIVGLTSIHKVFKKLNFFKINFNF